MKSKTNQHVSSYLFMAIVSLSSFKLKAESSFENLRKCVSGTLFKEEDPIESSLGLKNAYVLYFGQNTKTSYFTMDPVIKKQEDDRRKFLLKKFGDEDIFSQEKYAHERYIADSTAQSTYAIVLNQMGAVIVEIDKGNDSPYSQFYSRDQIRDLYYEANPHYNIVVKPTGEEKIIYRIETVNKYLQSEQSYATQILSDPEKHFSSWGVSPLDKNITTITDEKDPSFKKILDYTTASFASYFALAKRDIYQKNCYASNDVISNINKRLKLIISCTQIHNSNLIQQSSKIKKLLLQRREQIKLDCGN